MPQTYQCIEVATQITLLTDPLFWQVYDVTLITSIIQHAYLGSKIEHEMWECLVASFM